jgi:hypothetical protein
MAEFDWMNDSDSEPGDIGDTEQDPVLQRKAYLKSLSEAGGEFGKLASEALVSMEEREAAASKQAELVEAADGLLPESIDNLITEYESYIGEEVEEGQETPELNALQARIEAVKDALRAQTMADKQKADERVVADLRASLSEFDDATIEREVADFLEARKALYEFEATSDVLFENETWQAYEHMLWVRGRERKAADDEVQKRINDPVKYDAELAELEAANDAVIDGVLANV